jgi:hypothetical protein
MKKLSSFITRFSSYTGALVFGVLLGISTSAVFAWTAPTEAPPGGNVSGAPLTTGAGQIKTGGLVLNQAGLSEAGLLVAQGKVGFGMIPISDPSSDIRVEVAGKMTSASTQSTDPGNTVVTKDYVDAQGGGGGTLSLAGAATLVCAVTEATYTGDLGGISGANEKCDAEFPGFRFARYGMRANNYVWLPAYELYGGWIHMPSASNYYNNCGGWGENVGWRGEMWGYDGFGWFFDGGKGMDVPLGSREFAEVSCSNMFGIVCCNM